MNLGRDNNSIYKSHLPFYFYFLRWMAIFSLILLVVLRIDYRAIIVSTILLLLFLLINRTNYMIEVYDKYFKVILPSFFGKNFSEEATYYYSDVSEFVFEKGEYNWGKAIWGEIVKIFVPGSVSGLLFAYKNPRIAFKINKESGKDVEQVEIICNDNNRSLLKAIDMLKKRIGTGS